MCRQIFLLKLPLPTDDEGGSRSLNLLADDDAESPETEKKKAARRALVRKISEEGECTRRRLTFLGVMILEDQRELYPGASDSVTYSPFPPNCQSFISHHWLSAWGVDFMLTQ